MAILESAVFWIILAAASEIIALSPLKDNSIIQLVMHTLKSLKDTGKKSWATSHLMGSGCLDSTLVVHMTKSTVQYKRKSSTQPCRTS